VKTRQVQLVSRPEGRADKSHFTIAEVQLPSIRDGEVLVKNLYMSVDPYMRRCMDADGKDLAPWPIAGPLTGPSIGQVLQSRHRGFEPGDIVESMSGWQEHFISPGTAFVPYISADNALAKRRSGSGLEPKDYLGLLGIAAQTAYFGLTCAAKPALGSTLVVSSGAGTVGSIACQIGKIRGLRVVTSAGSDDKVSWLIRDLGVDHAFNYKRTPIEEGLKAGCPDGIDLVLENASPQHLSACLPLMNDHACALIAGFISMYSTGGRTGPIANFEYVLDKYLTIKAFPFTDYLGAYGQFVDEMTAWRTSEKLVLKETMHSGLEHAAEAFCGLFDGASLGKNLVRLCI
jgi:hypothetical protein